MPRCKALVRGGSRQCKRKALKGSMFCSQHGGVVASQSRDNRSRFSSQTHISRSASVRPLSNNNTGVLSSSLPPQSSRRRLNPAFTKIGWSNPLVQHYYTDKVGDLHRSATIFQATSVITAYPLAPVRATGPQGWLAAALVVGLVGAPFAAYANTADQLNDLRNFASTGKIHGHSVFGDTHQ